MPPFFFGLEHANRDFTNPQSLGKNIFTNAFPVSLCQYLALSRNVPIPTITACETDGALHTTHVPRKWGDLIGVAPRDAYFSFESVYDGFSPYTHTSANRSDVVVEDRKTGEHKRPLELKLVVAPTSGTAELEYKYQACEIVVRAPTIEQLIFSIAHSYGTDRRFELMQLIVDALGKPGDYRWENDQYMLQKLPAILKAAENITSGGIDYQTPLVLMTLWRTQGQTPVLQANAFDAFMWTDLAFLQLFIDQLQGTLAGGKVPAKISRPGRSLIWLVRALLEYTIQDSIDFSKIKESSPFTSQTDKAGAFSGDRVLRHTQSPEFLQPRVKREELRKFLSPRSAEFLLPERRLDAAIAIQHLTDRTAKW